MKKPAITGTEPTKKNIQAIAQIVDIITGRTGVKISKITTNAALSATLAQSNIVQAEIIAKLNEVIELLQG